MSHTSPSAVIAPDSFKGTITAAAAAAAAGALAEGWQRVRPADVIHLLPMADGGEGTIEAFATAVPGSVRMPVTVTGPDGAQVESCWLLLPPTGDTPAGTAVVELACTSGIELLGTPPRLRPLDAQTRGFGEAIAAALSHGVTKLVLGIGSSASTDGGTGMLTALGATALNVSGQPIADGGRGLADIASLDLSRLPALPPGGVTVLSDVTNPVTGALGAAPVFGPQKGATPALVTELDEGLERLARVATASGIQVDPATPGAGAAGGTGYALLAWGATLVQGSVAVAELIGLGDAMEEASFVITGEGSFDGQSAAGKVPAHVVALVASHGIPAGLVAGRLAADADTSAFVAAVSLTELAGSADAAMADAARWLHEAGAAMARELR